MSNTSLEQLKDKHLQEEWELLSDEAKRKSRDQALLLLGGIRVADKIAHSISSQVMDALCVFQKERLYHSFGYVRFVDFLDESDYSPMTKNQFYKRKELFDLEGAQLFDLMNELGVSRAVRKQLASGDFDAITIEGNTLKIGEQTADLSDFRLIKSLIESYSDEVKKISQQNASAKEKVAKLEKTVEEGSKQVESLMRQLDHAPSEYEAAYDSLIQSFVRFNDCVSGASDLERSKSDSQLETLWRFLEECRVRFGSNKFFEASGEGVVEIDPLVEEALNEVDLDD
jgi:hypothetical protein